MRKMLVGEHALHNGDHITTIQRIGDSHDRHLNFAVAESDYRKEHILKDGGSSSIHLLHKFPYSLVDDKIILFLSDVSSKNIFVIK